MPPAPQYHANRVPVTKVLRPSAGRPASVSPHSRDNILITMSLIAWAAINLVVGGVQIGSSSLYVSQALLVALSAGLIGLTLLQRVRFPMLFISIVLIGAAVLPMIAGGTSNERFLPEQLKLVMLIFGATAIAAHITWQHVQLLAKVLPAILFCVIVVVWTLGLGDYYGGGRFGVPSFGSPNSTAFMITVNMALVLYLALLRKRFVSRAYDGAIFLGLLVALYATESDGGTLSLLFLVLRFMGIGMRKLLIGGFGAAGLALIIVYLFSIELPELLGSGRLAIWEILLESQLRSWQTILVGFGPGAIDLEPGFTASVRSAHSMFFEIFYSYGAIGLAALAYAIVHLGRRLGRAELGRKQRVLLEGIYVSLLAGAFVDAYFFTAQLVWLAALVLGFFGLARHRSTHALVSKASAEWAQSSNQVGGFRYNERR